MTDLSSPEIQATFKNNRVAVILTDYYALNGDTWGGYGGNVYRQGSRQGKG